MYSTMMVFPFGDSNVLFFLENVILMYLKETIRGVTCTNPNAIPWQHLFYKSILIKS